MADYTHLILGHYNRGSILSKKTKNKVTEWVKGGGTLIASRGAAGYVSREILGQEPAEPKAITMEARAPYSAKQKLDAAHVIGGAVFASDLDISHPIGFGFARELLATHRSGSRVLPAPKDPFASVAVYQDEPLLSGYASTERQAQLAGTPSVVAQRKGAGSVILFADNTNFRATYLGAEKLLLNALFFSKAFRSARLPAEEAEIEDAHAH